MYAGSKDSLKSILEWLEGTDDGGWEDRIELGEECRSDMERMARPMYRRDKTGSRSAQGPERNPYAERLNRAIPHIRAMLTAMRNRNRATALEHGKAAWAVM
jgi:hypothetical protein